MLMWEVLEYGVFLVLPCLPWITPFHVTLILTLGIPYLLVKFDKL